MREAGHSQIVGLEQGYISIKTIDEKWSVIYIHTLSSAWDDSCRDIWLVLDTLFGPCTDLALCIMEGKRKKRKPQNKTHYYNIRPLQWTCFSSGNNEIIQCQLNPSGLMTSFRAAPGQRSETRWNQTMDKFCCHVKVIIFVICFAEFPGYLNRSVIMAMTSAFSFFGLLLPTVKRAALAQEVG